MTNDQLAVMVSGIVVVSIYQSGLAYKRGETGWWIHLLLGPGCVAATSATGCPLFMFFTLGWAFQVLGQFIEKGVGK